MCEDCNEVVRVFEGDFDWIHLAQIMALWRDVLNTLMNFRSVFAHMSDI
jgi:hypothetical protein